MPISRTRLSSNRKPKRNQSRQNALLPRLKAQPYQKSVTLWIAGNDQLLTTNGAGTVALAVPINTNTIIPFFSTTWQTTWDEYNIVAVDMLFVPFNTSTGITRMYIDENSAGTPTNITAQGRLGITVSNNSACSPRNKFQGQLQAGHLFKWTAQDVGDLSWNNVLTVPVSISYLKVYTDVALGSPIATTLGFIRVNVRVRFRMPLQ